MTCWLVFVSNIPRTKTRLHKLAIDVLNKLLNWMWEKKLAHLRLYNKKLTPKFLAISARVWKRVGMWWRATMAKIVFIVVIFEVELHGVSTNILFHLNSLWYVHATHPFRSIHHTFQTRFGWKSSPRHFFVQGRLLKNGLSKEVGHSHHVSKQKVVKRLN